MVAFIINIIINKSLNVTKVVLLLLENAATKHRTCATSPYPAAKFLGYLNRYQNALINLS